MNSTNLGIQETNNLIKELRKCSALFGLHNLRFWRKTETDFFQWWCLHTDNYKQTQLIWNALNELIQLDLGKRKSQCFSCCFKNDAVLFGDLKSATVCLKIIDLMSKRNSAWSVYCFCHVDEKEQTASEVTGLKLCFLSCLFFSFLSIV